MRDHRYYNGGKPIPVAQMCEQDILECLREGRVVFVTNDDNDNVSDIMLRLEVELIRRRLGLPIRGTSE